MKLKDWQPQEDNSIPSAAEKGALGTLLEGLELRRDMETEGAWKIEEAGTKHCRSPHLLTKPSQRN